MASTSLQEEQSESGIGFDTSIMNQLIYSLGRLKFSLRSLGAMNLQMALYPFEETEVYPDSEFIHSLESNKILEKVIQEISSQKSNSEGNSKTDHNLHKDCPSMQISSIEDLEFVYERLNNELSSIRSHYQTMFSEKSGKT